MLLWLAALASSYELVAFQGRDRHHSVASYVSSSSATTTTTKKLSTSTLKGLALVPFARDDVIEAEESRKKDHLLMEFVHVHKCGGSTFNHVVPNFLCHDSLAISKKVCSDARCCLVRPKSAVEAYKTKPSTVRYLSAREEFSAYVLPWNRNESVVKVTMVRRPYERWTSEVLFACRRANRHRTPLKVKDALESPDQERPTRRNRIAQGLVPPVILGDSGKNGAALTDDAFKAEVNALRAFAFIGVVEHYDRSMCLFARTFLTPDKVCLLCCDHTPAIPHVNDSPKAHRNCSASMFTDEDRSSYDFLHAADRQVYDVASSIFEARFAFAEKHHWGNDPHSCNCSFLKQEKKGLHTTTDRPHHLYDDDDDDDDDDHSKEEGDVQSEGEKDHHSEDDSAPSSR